MTEVHVDVYAQDYGWLFEDLKRHFVAAARCDLRVTASTRPHPGADRWIALRGAETHCGPDPARTVACIHDFYDDPGLYTPAGDRRGVRDAAALWLCHPGVRALLARDDVDLTGRSLLERPIGALAIFSPRQRLPARFAVGWIGRNDPVKRLNVFVAAMARAAARQAPFDVLLVGEDLAPVAAAIAALDVTVRHHDRRVVSIEGCPPLYRQMDVLVITSASEGQPLVLFEALACGVPVVASPVGWAPHFAALAPDCVRLADGAAAIEAALTDIRGQRDALFARRQAMADLVRPWQLEGWVEAMLGLAADLPGEVAP